MVTLGEIGHTVPYGTGHNLRQNPGTKVPGYDQLVPTGQETSNCELPYPFEWEINTRRGTSWERQNSGILS